MRFLSSTRRFGDALGVILLGLSCSLRVSLSFTGSPRITTSLAPKRQHGHASSTTMLVPALFATEKNLPEMTTTSPAATANSTKRQDPPSQKLYLLSLQWTPDERISKPCRDVWKWKDATLGDGRDFFVPKPKTIGALQNLLLQQPHHDLAANITQVSVLSNCARFEIICLCDKDPVPTISNLLMTQVQASASRDLKKNALTSVLAQSMDRPEWVLVDINREDKASLSASPSSNLDADSKELERCWEVKRGTQDILHHLSLVAAGMASRPRRPERETIFRPFSSRDAHILLQLKRTKEIVAQQQQQQQHQEINQLLEYALRAGKAARNVQIVPELKRLQKYGTGDTSKYSMEPPRETLLEVSEAVVEKAIRPLVKECVQVSSITDEVSHAIATLRQSAVADLATSPSERAWIKKRLHQPTMDLRQGKLRVEDIEMQLKLIEKELEETRQ